MWSEDFSLSLFESDECIRVRREAHESIPPSCIVATGLRYKGLIKKVSGSQQDGKRFGLKIS